MEVTEWKNSGTSERPSTIIGAKES